MNSDPNDLRDESKSKEDKDELWGKLDDLTNSINTENSKIIEGVEKIQIPQEDEVLDDSIEPTKKTSIHGPSIAIGAGITIAIVAAIFFSAGIIDDSQQILEQISTPEHVVEKKTVDISVFRDNGSPILGQMDAPITMIEFGDYQCFFCNKFFHDTEHAILDEFVKSGKVKIIFKDFTIIGQDSVNAAHAAQCAGDQELFWEYHDELYRNWGGENNGWASSENLYQFAENISLDTEKFSECMNSAKFQNKIIASNNDAKELGLTGTPAFFIIGPSGNINKIGGAQPFDVFEKIFESELK